MKITINTDSGAAETEVSITCERITPEVERILAALQMLDRQMTVTKNDEIFRLDISKIIYIETVDRKTFVYTSDSCYESRLRLYETEEQLCECGFLRVSKACLVNTKFIRSLRSELNRKLRVTLENGEQIIVSRQYADELKNRLGVK